MVLSVGSGGQSRVDRRCWQDHDNAFLSPRDAQMFKAKGVLLSCAFLDALEEETD